MTIPKDETDLNTIDSTNSYVSKDVRNLNHQFKNSSVEFGSLKFIVARNRNEPWYVASADFSDFGQIKFE